MFFDNEDESSSSDFATIRRRPTPAKVVAAKRPSFTPYINEEDEEQQEHKVQLRKVVKVPIKLTKLIICRIEN